MASTRTTVVAYDISDPKRLKKVADIMEGFGYRIQYSVFLCALSPTEVQKLKLTLSKVINNANDQCLVIDLGPEDSKNSIEAVGKPLLSIPTLTIV